MVNNLLISVIIPAYNASRTVENCLRSLFLQTYSNFEIILINDGSQDDTLDIALKLSKIDNRLRVFNQDNSGVSCTRNRGLELANGHFFCYVDADDTVSSEYLENLEGGILGNESYNGLIIQQLNFLDLLGAKVEEDCLVFSDSIVWKENYGRLFEEYDIIKYGFNCGKLFSLDLVRENNIRYNNEIGISEDLIFMLDYLYYSDYVHFIDGADYNYITTSYTLGNIKYASFSSELNLLKDYLIKIENVKIKFNISEDSLIRAYENSGIILMRLFYSMYRLSNVLPSLKVRLKNLKILSNEHRILLNDYFPSSGIKEKLSKFLLTNSCFFLFDRFRLFIRRSQLKRLNSN